MAQEWKKRQRDRKITPAGWINGFVRREILEFRLNSVRGAITPALSRRTLINCQHSWPWEQLKGSPTIPARYREGEIHWHELVKYQRKQALKFASFYHSYDEMKIVWFKYFTDIFFWRQTASQWLYRSNISRKNDDFYSLLLLQQGFNNSSPTIGVTLTCNKEKQEFSLIKNV